MLSFAGCSLPQPWPCSFVWRLFSGIAGARADGAGPVGGHVLQQRSSASATLGPLMFCGALAWAPLLAATLGAHVCAQQP